MRIKFVVHKNLTSKELQDIIQIKSISWPYSKEKQLKWIERNINENDVHVLLFSKENKLIAYANLINIDLTINNQNNLALGVGNVCAYEKGEGFGKLLMHFINEFLLQNHKIGLLFCNKRLINFYLLNQWVLIDQNKIVLSFKNEIVETMIFNCNEGLESMEYSGLAF